MNVKPKVFQNRKIFGVFELFGLRHRDHNEEILFFKVVDISNSFNWDLVGWNWNCTYGEKTQFWEESISKNIAYFGTFEISEFWPKAQKIEILNLFRSHNCNFSMKTLLEKNQICSFWNKVSSKADLNQNNWYFLRFFALWTFWTHGGKD